MATSSLCLLRFCRFGFVGFMDFLFEDRLKRMPFCRNSILRSAVLLLHNFLGGALRLQHAECGQKPLNRKESTHCVTRSTFACPDLARHRRREAARWESRPPSSHQFKSRRERLR